MQVCSYDSYDNLMQDYLELESPSEEDCEVLPGNHLLISGAGTNCYWLGASHQLHTTNLNNLQVYSNESEFDAQESDFDRHNDAEEDDIAWSF